MRRSPLNRHFTMANLAGYPALNVVNGFTDAGTPSSICMYGRRSQRPRFLRWTT
jgi:Asp-tRNA(Asn)/Glu-tRNA(Gln) amidotransferase A subunit family amidase